MTFMSACRRALQFSLQKTMEQYRLFFLEDALSPENIDYFKQIRANCTTPLAMGELFNNPHEWNNLIRDSVIDFIRVHVSRGGRFNTLPKMAAMAEAFQVRTAWHGPGDVSPIGHCANVTLDVVCYNFGVQEWTFRERSRTGSIRWLSGGQRRLCLCPMTSRVGE